MEKNNKIHHVKLTMNGKELSADQIRELMDGKPEVVSSSAPTVAIISGQNTGYAVKITKGSQHDKDCFALFESEAGAMRFVDEESADPQHGEGRFEYVGEVPLNPNYVAMLSISGRDPNHIYVYSI
jgi:hypothetical protein